jgi:hypothetical protein
VGVLQPPSIVNLRTRVRLWVGQAIDLGEDGEMRFAMLYRTIEFQPVYRLIRRIRFTNCAYLSVDFLIDDQYSIQELNGVLQLQGNSDVNIECLPCGSGAQSEPGGDVLARCLLRGQQTSHNSSTQHRHRSPV